MKNYIEYGDYLGTVNYSAEDSTFYGKIQGISDLVLFEGDSVDELKKSFEDAVIDYLATCQEVGKEPNKMYKGVFNVRIPSEMHKQLSKIANKKGIKLNVLVNKTFNYLVKNENKILE